MQELATRENVALVIDAADGFDAVRPGPAAQVISLHACKALAIGEGGLVVSTDTTLIEKIRQLANFGFDDDRSAVACGMNGKMSEYAAAVGLAALDGWAQTRCQWISAATIYDTLLREFGLSLSADADHAFSMAIVDVGVPVSHRIEEAMRAQNIEVRRLWGNGCHRHPAYETFAHDGLTVTVRLTSQVITLPFYPDLAAGDAERVVAALATILDVAPATRLKFAGPA